MDWSIGLLAPPVLALYRRISVIAGTFSAETAAAILEGGERRGLAPLGIDVEAGLTQLAEASLLRHEDGRAFAMLTTVRADAKDRLARSGEAVAMRWAHAYQVLAVAEEAELALPRDREVEALDRLRRRTTTPARRSNGRRSRATGRSPSGWPGRSPSSGEAAATTRRAACGWRRRCRSASILPRSTAARP